MLDELEASILAIEIQSLYNDLDFNVQRSFVDYLQDEISAQDDQFGPIVDEVVNALREYKNIEIVASHLVSTHSPKHVTMVLQAIQEYLKDIYYD